MSLMKQADKRDPVLSPGRAPRCLSLGSVTLPGLGARASPLRLTPGS